MITTGKPTLYRGNGSLNAGVVATAAPSTETWQHLAVTMSGTTATHYLGGASNGSGTLSTTMADSLLVPMMLGNRGDLFTDFKGLMTECAIFDDALNSTEINDIMDNGLEGAVSTAPMHPVINIM